MGERIEKKIQHLNMVQGVINRMASNMFALKGWAVSLVVGLFALAAKDAEPMYFILAYIPIVLFWALDAYYLLQERLYRSLYERVRAQPEDEIDFSMVATVKEFPSKYNNYFRCVLSKTELPFYLVLALICAAVVYLAEFLI